MSTKVLSFSALLIGLISCAGCSKKAEQAASAADTLAVDTAATETRVRTSPLWQEPEYRDWTSITSDFVVLYYPKTHQHAADMPQEAQGYARAIRSITDKLGSPAPFDTVRIFYYTGPGQGSTMTGHPMPFADSTGVHYWPSYSRGVSLMQYLLPRIYGAASRLPIMQHGLIACFDYAGENYHKTTLDYAKDTFFIPLARLAVDTAMNSETERYQSAEAASFVGFLIGQYGPLAVRSLYLSNPPFDSAVRNICGVSVDSLQDEWMAYVRTIMGDTLSSPAQPAP